MLFVVFSRPKIDTSVFSNVRSVSDAILFFGISLNNKNFLYCKDNLFDIPPVFELIQAESSTEWREMYQVFNMGHRMELYVDEKFADEIINTSKSFDVDAKIIGRVQSSNEKKLTISSKYGTFEY